VGANVEGMEEVDKRINNLKEIIRKTPVDVLQERIYVCLANGCILLTAFKQDKGAKGWSSKLHNDLNEPMLNSKDQEYIEKTFSTAPWIMNVFEEHLSASSAPSKKKKQKGGSGVDMPTISEAGSQFIKATTIPPMTPQDISLDATFDAFIDKLNGIDDFWGKIAYESPGFLKKVYDTDDVNITTPFGNLPIPVPPFLTLFMALMDSLRFSLSLVGVKSNVMTIFIMLEELLTGQWRQMILTAVGFISPSGVAIGTVLKYIVNAMMLVSPEIRTSLFKDVIRSGKSGFIGFLLWSATIFPPKKYRVQLEDLLTTLRTSIQGFDDKIKVLQDQGTVALSSQGKKIDFTGIDLTNLRRISFQDIQNLQSLAQWDVLVCSLEFQEIMAVVETNPLFRLIMELLNVPTTPEDKYRKCGAPPYLPMQEKVQKATTPVIVDTVVHEDLLQSSKEETETSEQEEAVGDVPDTSESDTKDQSTAEPDIESVAKDESSAVEPEAESAAEAAPAPTPEAYPIPAAESPQQPIPAPVHEEPIVHEAAPRPALPKMTIPKMKLPFKGGSRSTKKSRKLMKLKKTKSIRNRKSTPRRVSRRLQQ